MPNAPAPINHGAITPVSGCAPTRPVCFSLNDRQLTAINCHFICTPHPPRSPRSLPIHTLPFLCRQLFHHAGPESIWYARKRPGWCLIINGLGFCCFFFFFAFSLGGGGDVRAEEEGGGKCTTSKKKLEFGFCAKGNERVKGGFKRPSSAEYNILKTGGGVLPPSFFLL